MSTRPSRRRFAFLAAGGLVAVALLAAPRAGADEPPTPPPTPPADAPSSPDAPATPDARPRPPEPPPPDGEIPGWDVHHRDRATALPPPFPPPDPFAERPIQFRFDREVSADGRIKEERRVPQWVDVVDRNKIRDWRPLDLGEILRHLPNVAVADGGSPFLQMPVIRSLGGDRVRILTDGVWPTTQLLGVAGGSISLWDPESTERVEVYHGPGAYLRGAEAGGGMINVVPRRPWRHECRETWWEESTSFRSADMKFRQRLGVETGAGRWAGLFGATWTDVGDRDTGSGELDPSSYEEIAADAAIDYFLDNQTTFGFTGQYVRARDIRTPAGNGDDFSQPKYERLFLGATLSSVNVGTIFHGARMSVSFDSLLLEDEQKTPLSLTSQENSEDDVKRWDFHLQGQLYLQACHDTWAELTVAYARLKRTEEVICVECEGPVAEKARLHEIVERQTSPGVTATSTTEAEELRVIGLLEDETHSDCLDTHVGLRGDLTYVADSRTGEDDVDFLLGAAAGFARHCSECQTFYGNASVGWRHPSLFEMFSVSVLDGITVFGNPDLDDEFSWNVEVGSKWARWNASTFQVAGFVHGIEDYVGRRAVGSDQEWANVGDVVLYGAEATGAWRPDPCRCEGWEVFGALGVTLSSDEDVVAETPIHGRVGMRYGHCCENPCGLRRWFVEGALRASEDARHQGTGGDAFVTADVLAGVGISRGGRRAIRATLGVTNLFDESYTEPFARLTAPGRSLIASLSIDF